VRTSECCSVVFGVRSRLVVVANISSSSPAINKLCRLPATSGINSPWRVAAECIALATPSAHSTQWSQILAAIAILPHLHSTPPLGGPRRNVATTFSMEKLEWFGYPTMKIFEDIFSRLPNSTNMTDRRTDGRTDGQTPHDGIGRVCIASRGKTPLRIVY